MSINKIALSFALAGILGATAAVAEQSGAFIGVQGAYGSADMSLESGSAINDIAAAAGSGTGNAVWSSDDAVNFGAFRYGIAAGYKQFFTEKFGLRYYGVLDYGTNIHEEDVAGETVKAEFNTLNVNANVDALFNFISGDSFDFGIFGGLSLGYANHSPKDSGDSSESVGGFDAGINLGLRVNIASHHGIELFSRIGLAEQKDEGSLITVKYSQPYQIGLRYAFSF